MKKENNIEKIITEAVKNLSEITDANLIVGKPLMTENNTTIIPLSKVTIGFLSGGGEYGEVKVLKPKNYPNLGASGSIAVVKPSGFLIEKNGKVKYIHCPQDYFERAIESIDNMVKSLNEKTSKN